MLLILRKLSLLFLLKFKERVHFIIFITLLYTAISFVIRHGQTKQSSKYRDREGYLLEVHAKPPLSAHLHELVMFLLDAPTVRCVTASKRASRTRRFWTTCCCQRVMTSGFCPRSKVHWGPHPTAHQGDYNLPCIHWPSTIQSTSNIIGTATTT